MKRIALIYIAAQRIFPDTKRVRDFFALTALLFMLRDLYKTDMLVGFVSSAAIYISAYLCYNNEA